MPAADHGIVTVGPPVGKSTSGEKNPVEVGSIFSWKFAPEFATMIRLISFCDAFVSPLVTLEFDRSGTDVVDRLADGSGGNVILTSPRCPPSNASLKLM